MVSINPNDIARYVNEGYFPYKAIWEYLKPPFADTQDNVNDRILSMLQPAKQNPAFRDWRFGAQELRFNCGNAEIFRRYYAESKTGIYHVGAVRKGPLDVLETSPVLSNKLVIDFDATDYTTIRSLCDCGEERSNMCLLCTGAVVAAAETSVGILKEIYGWKRIYCWYSGNRGIHIHVLDYEACSLSDPARAAVVATITRPFCLDDSTGEFDPALQPIAHVYAPILKYKESLDNMPIQIIVDAGVTEETVHVARGPFSIHEYNGRVFFPLKRASDLQDVKAYPTLNQVLDMDNTGVTEQWTDAIKLLESWNTVD
jgi:hypothetical protein